MSRIAGMAAPSDAPSLMRQRSILAQRFVWQMKYCKSAGSSVNHIHIQSFCPRASTIPEKCLTHGSLKMPSCCCSCCCLVIRWRQHSAGEGRGGGIHCSRLWHRGQKRGFSEMTLEQSHSSLPYFSCHA